MKNSKLIGLLMLPLIVLLPGCLKTPPYIPKNLKPLNATTSQDTKTQKQVTVHHAVVTKEQAQELFGSYATNLDFYKIVPVQLTIENHGMTTWILTDKNIRLAKLDLNDIDNKLLNAQGWRPPVIFFGGMALAGIVGLAVAATILICSAPTCGCPCMFIGPLFFGGLCANAIFLTTSCIATYDALDKTSTKNKIHCDLKQKRGSDCMLIKPGAYADIMFFVQQELLPHSYDIVLIDQTEQKHELRFEITRQTGE